MDSEFQPEAQAAPEGEAAPVVETAETPVAEAVPEAAPEAAAESVDAEPAAEPVSGPAGWTERRAARRLPLHVPVFVTVTEGGIKDHAAVTRNVSASGVFLEMESPLPEGTEIEFTLTLPPEITHSGSIRVHCLGTVVRVEHGERAGVAAAIDEFDLLA